MIPPKDVIETLIETCRDGENGYAHAASFVQDPKLKEYFQQRTAERHKFGNRAYAGCQAPRRSRSQPDRHRCRCAASRLVRGEGRLRRGRPRNPQQRRAGRRRRQEKLPGGPEHAAASQPDRDHSSSVPANSAGARPGPLLARPKSRLSRAVRYNRRLWLFARTTALRSRCGR